MVAILVPPPYDISDDLPPSPARWSPQWSSGSPADRAPAAPGADPIVDLHTARRRPVVHRGLDPAARFRRRRLVALVAGLALVVPLVAGANAVVGALGSVGSSGPQPVEAPFLSPAPGDVYVVQPGDTLWTIALAIAPDADPRSVVDALAAANGGPELQVGQRLVIEV